MYEACLAGAHCFVCFRMFQMSFHLEWEGGSVLCYSDGRWSTRTVKSVTFADLNYRLYAHWSACRNSVNQWKMEAKPFSFGPMCNGVFPFDCFKLVLLDAGCNSTGCWKGQTGFRAWGRRAPPPVGLSMSWGGKTWLEFIENWKFVLMRVFKCRGGVMVGDGGGREGSLIRIRTR